MANKTDYLDRIYVATACRANWETMPGSDQVRHCAECNRQVYDLSKMTRSQAERLIIIKEGNFCASISRRPDGTVITLEEPARQFIARRASPLAAAVVTAAISVTSSVLAPAAASTCQAQVTSVAPDKGSQSSKPETPFKPITLEPADPGVLDEPIGIVEPMVGSIAMKPSTLRVLYDKSDLIIVGRAAFSSSISGEGNDGVVTRYLVSSVVKGKSRKQLINVIHYQLADERFDYGRTALLFLSKGNAINGGSRGAYVLAEPGAGIKALPQAAIDSYAARIRDLDAIERSEHSSADIAEWLVQCAEDPATRWEGASDLADGSEQSEEEGLRHPIIAPSGSAEAGDDVPLNIKSLQMREGIDNQGGPDSKLATMLMAEQRERLVTALLATQSIGRGEVKLIELIKTWNDPRLVEFLLARLHEMEDSPTEFADGLVQHLSDSVEGCEVSALADSFRDLPSAEDVSNQSEEEQNEEEQIGQEHDEVLAKTIQADKAKEAGRKRSAALKEFLAAVESRVRPKDPIIH